MCVNAQIGMDNCTRSHVCNGNFKMAGHAISYELRDVLYSTPIGCRILNLHAREVDLKKALMAGNFGGGGKNCGVVVERPCRGSFIPYREWETGNERV